MDWANLTWDSARAGGFVAYLLLSAAVALGIALSFGWRSESWPRFLGREVHNHVVLLTLVFSVLHTLAVWLDPFMRFTPAEVLVPLVSHYRPLWVALGITAAYLLLAIWLTERLRPWIGWSLWRRAHYLAFPAWGLATLHGLGNGSDSQAVWAFAIYAACFSLVAALLAIRVARSTVTPGARFGVAGGLLVLAAAGWVWALSGPIQPGWNQVANDGNGNGSRLTAAAGGPNVTPPPATPRPGQGFNLPFESQFQGAVELSGPGSDGLSTLTIDGTLQDRPQGDLKLVLRGRERSQGFGVVAGQVTYRPATGGSYTGQVVSTRGGRVGAVLEGPSGPFRIDFAITQSSGSSVEGVVDAAAGAGDD
jgi:hypothetical protein